MRIVRICSEPEAKEGLFAEPTQLLVESYHAELLKGRIPDNF
jgi:hypothetical protein